MRFPTIYNYKNLPYKEIENAPQEARKRGNQGTKKRRTYKSLVCAFDIETTRISDSESIMYLWQAQLGPDLSVMGRSWKECFRFFHALAAACERDDTWLVFFVHNLSFEFAFLAGQYRFTSDEVFAVGPRKVLKCDMLDRLEFRCSYLHSNMSLAEFTEKMGVEHAKLSGERFDYEKKRYPWTALSDYEIEYGLHDVKGLVEAITIEMQHDGDNLYTLPLTSTGYVRRDVKKAMRRLQYGYVKSMLPTWDVYVLLREAFRGGNTHANRYYAGQIIKNVKSADRSSSYPDCECNNRFPVSEFREVRDPDADKLADLINRRHKAILARVTFENIRLKDRRWGCPYIPTDKCRYLSGEYVDNGRVLGAEYLEITVTDIDLRIILSEYVADGMGVKTLYHARYGWLPDALVDVIIRYYRDKTELKGVTGSEIQYVKQKNKLNAIYGMSAQNPVKVSQIYDAAAPESFRDAEEDPRELLEESNRKAFFPYQWGVWCTALARYRLEEGIRLAHGPQADFIYCDTDSVKYIGDIDWSEYNSLRIEDSESCGAWADDKNGTRHFMGVFEPDGEYLRFATRGAKKYAYTERNKRGYVKLHITIAGVNKKAGARELAKAGGLRAFLLPSFTFKEDEHEAVYTDHVRRFEYIDGHRLRIAPGVTIRPSYKTLSDTQEYIDLLSDPAAFVQFFDDKLLTYK